MIDRRQSAGRYYRRDFDYPFYANALPIDPMVLASVTNLHRLHMFSRSPAQRWTVPFYIGSKWLSEYLQIIPKLVIDLNFAKRPNFHI